MFKKSLFLSHFVLFSAFVYVNADETKANSKNNNWLFPLKNSSKSCSADEMTNQNVHGVTQMKVAPHIELNASNYANFSVDATYLYMQARQDNLDFALKETETDVTSFNGKHILRSEDLDFDWGSGLRLGLGYLFGWYDQWDLRLNWTYFHNKAHGRANNKASSSEFANLFSGWFPAEFGGQLGTAGRPGSASAHWSLVYNTIDLEIGRDYFISKAISLHPHAGLRAAFIHQDYHVKYKNGLFQQFDGAMELAQSFANTHMNAENDYNGLGLRLGGDFLWHFSNHFGFFTKLSASLLYGRFIVEEKMENAVFFPIGVGDNIFRFPTNYKEGISAVRTNLEGALGLTFETDFANNCHMFLSIGYELSEWFNQLQLAAFNRSTLVENFQASATQMNTYVLDRKEGDLGLQGLSIELRFDF